MSEQDHRLSDPYYLSGLVDGAAEEQDRIIAEAQNAYPADVFPEPDWEQVRQALAGIGVTLDAVAGSLLRRQIPAFIKGENK